MYVVDFTHILSEDSPVFYGAKPPKRIRVASVEANGYAETSLSFYSHTGTHMDAPSHMLSSGKTLDALPVTQFFGTGLVIDCTDLASNEAIGMNLIERQRALCDAADFLLFHTGHSRFWGDRRYASPFPIPDTEVIDYLITSDKKGVGIDAVSIDAIDSQDFVNHHRLLAAGLVIIENLCQLDRMGQGPFSFYALPLKFHQADGAPVRAIGYRND